LHRFQNLWDLWEKELPIPELGERDGVRLDITLTPNNR